MWSVGRDSLDIYIGSTEGGLSMHGGSHQWISYDDVRAGVETLFAQAAESSKSTWRLQRSARVWFSGAIARPFLLEPIAGLRGWDEARSFAQSAAEEAVGIPGPCSVELEAWPGSGPVLVTAMSEELLESIESVAAQHRLRVRSMRPWWAAAFNEVAAKDEGIRLVSISDDESMVLLGRKEGRFETASCYTPGTSDEQTSRLLSRLSLVAGAGVGQVSRIKFTKSGEPTSPARPFGFVETRE